VPPAGVTPAGTDIAPPVLWLVLAKWQLDP